MAENTLITQGANPTLTADNVDQYKLALTNDVVPRNSSGTPESEAGRLGTPLLPWDRGYFKNGIYIDGLPLGNGGSSEGDSQNYIVSCQSAYAASESDTPYFIKPHGSSNSLQIVVNGVPTPADLEVVINGVAVSVTSNITVSGLTSAPSTNNTATVDASATYINGQTETKYIRHIPLTGAGSEITSRATKIICLLINGEYIWGYLYNATNFFPISRGAFWNSSGNPSGRATITAGQTATLMNIAWIFLENTGLTGVASYTTPVVDYVAPSSPSTNDYWYDLGNLTWKVWSGSAWSVSNRILLGVGIINSSGACVRAKSFEPRRTLDSTNTIRLFYYSVTTYIAQGMRNKISVLGRLFEYFNETRWSMSADLETGYTEAADTKYYFYITQSGAQKISPEAPEYKPELLGAYHPHKSWRYVGSGLNNSSSNLTAVIPDWVGGGEIITDTTDQIWIKPAHVSAIKVTLVGAGGGTGTNGGGGGSGAICIANSLYFGLNGFNCAHTKCGVGGTVSGTNGTSGGDTKFDWQNFFTLLANGGAQGFTIGGSGGTASGGDINITGQAGSSRTSSDAFTNFNGGNGGSNTYGFGGIGSIQTSSTAATPAKAATGYGAGGGGASTDDTTSTAGRDGLILIEYIN